MRDQFDSEIINEMRRFENLLEDLAQELNFNTPITTSRKSFLMRKYSDIKNQLRSANATGTVKGKKRAQTESEARYFSNAIRQALIALRAPTNSNPQKSNWALQVSEARSEISYHLHRMENDLSMQV